MNDADLPSTTAPIGESIEGRRSHELVRDEDVLSVGLQHALEQVGSAVGVVAALALLFSQLPRAGRLLAAMGAKAIPPNAGDGGGP